MVEPGKLCYLHWLFETVGLFHSNPQGPKTKPRLHKVAKHLRRGSQSICADVLGFCRGLRENLQLKEVFEDPLAIGSLQADLESN